MNQRTQQRAPAARQPAPTTSPLDAAISATEEIIVYGTGEKIVVSWDEVRMLIATPTKSGKLPSDREIALFLKICKARGFNPYAKDAFLVGYDGRDGSKFETIVALVAMLKRCEGNSDYMGKRSGVLVWDAAAKEVVKIEGDTVPKDLPVVGGWCEIHRKGKLPEYATATMKAYNKGFGHWSVDPNWMITKCAIAKACRQAYPSDVGDLMIQEEMGSIMDRTIERTNEEQAKRQAASLNARLAAMAKQTPVPVVDAPEDAQEPDAEVGDAWEPDEEERAAIEQQLLIDTHGNAAEM